MVKVTSVGISFSYYDDILTWVWPWNRWTEGHYASALYGPGFSSLREYWTYVGSIHAGLRTHKLLGLNAEGLANDKASVESRFGPVLLIKNIQVMEKPISFWGKLGKDKAKELCSDFCLLYPSTMDEATRLLSELPPEFADVDLFHLGKLIDTNAPGDADTRTL